MKVCTKQKSDVTNDATSAPAVMSCMSDIVFAAESNQVCRRGGRGEEKAGEQGHAFHEPPPPPRLHLWDNLRPSQRAAAALMMKMASSFIFSQTHVDPIHMLLPDHNKRRDTNTRA